MCIRDSLASIRTKDIIGRWSSEEFIILLPESGPHEAMDIAESLRVGLATMDTSDLQSQIQITGSFGVSFSASSKSLNELTANAEDALYQARRDGSNRVCKQLIGV